MGMAAQVVDRGIAHASVEMDSGRGVEGVRDDGNPHIRHCHPNRFVIGVIHPGPYQNSHQATESQFLRFPVLLYCSTSDILCLPRPAQRSHIHTDGDHAIRHR